MNWDDAVKAMYRGSSVRRVSQTRRSLAGHDSNGFRVYDVGTEPACLRAAWTHRDEPVRVFRGALSGCDWIPTEEDRTATDWEIA
jgi:hypothetical protein